MAKFNVVDMNGQHVSEIELSDAVFGMAVPIGPYESKTVNRASANAEESLRKLEQLGLEVSIEDSERKKR